MYETHRVAELQYGKVDGTNRLELVVPSGTKLKDLARLEEVIFKDIVARLPRGCQACLSGEPLFIRERLENVIRVDLESGKVVGA
jgi:hypothetical protein